MIQKCKHRKNADFGVCRPGLDVNIAQALENGKVEATGVPLRHNGISNSDMIGKPGDALELADMVSFLKNTISLRNAKKSGNNGDSAAGSQQSDNSASSDQAGGSPAD